MKLLFSSYFQSSSIGQSIRGINNFLGLNLLSLTCLIFWVLPFYQQMQNIVGYLFLFQLQDALNCSFILIIM